MAGPFRLFLMTALAMVAFAANSVLGRMGLVETEIGAGSFTLIRLVSGAVFLVAICLIQRKSIAGTWVSAAALLGYAATFSYAYLNISAGMGAIILFAMVQFSMLSWGLYRGETLSPLQWGGFSVAIGGLVWLVSPGVEAPPVVSAVLIGLSGLSWGIYSLIGPGKSDPTSATTGNFIRATVLSLPIFAVAFFVHPEPSPPIDGAALAVISGAITSGLGYAIWYQAVRYLSATRAGIAQLTVPAIAAIGGVIFLAEPITLRFAISTALILGGVGLAVLTRTPASPKAGE